MPRSEHGSRRCRTAPRIGPLETSMRNTISENLHDASQPVRWRRRSNSHGRRHDARTDPSCPIAKKNCEWLHRNNASYQADAGQDQPMLLHDVFSSFDMDSKQRKLWVFASIFTEHTTDRTRTSRYQQSTLFNSAFAPCWPRFHAFFSQGVAPEHPDVVGPSLCAFRSPAGIGVSIGALPPGAWQQSVGRGRKITR